MMVMEQPTPIHKKKSLFRRFTFKEQPAARPIRPVHPLALPSPPPSPPSSIESHPRSSGKLQRRSSSAPLTPPASPKEPEKEMPRRKQHIQKSSISRPRLIVQDNHPIATKLPLFEFEQNHQYRPKSQHARHDSAQSSASSASRTTAHSKSTSTSQSPASTSTSSIRSSSPSLPPPPPGTHNGRVLPHARPARPFSSHPNITPWNVFLPPSHTHALYLGALPTSSSEKWFIYSEGPDALGKLKVHFHRSGNGQKIAELFVVMDVKGEGAGKIVGIKWDAGWETNRMSESEAKFVVREACVDMLGVQLEAGF